MRRAVLASTFLFACAHAQTAAAAEPQGATAAVALDQAVELDRITVTQARRVEIGYGAEQSSTATKSDLPILKTPQAITVVTDDVLRDQAAVELVDAMRNVSGITEANTFGNTGDNFLIRGFESGFGAVLRDGYASVSDRALNAAVERVEVLKGPSSLLYGRFEPGGLINVVTRKPEDAFGFEARTQHSSKGTSRQTADVTGPLGGGFGYRLIGQYEDSDYWRNVGRATTRTFLAPSLAWSGDAADVLLQYEYLDSAQPFDRGRIYFDGRRLPTPAERSFAEEFAGLTEQIHTGNLTFGYSFSPSLRMETRLATQRSRGDDLQVRPRALVLDANGQPTGEFIRSVDGNRDLFTDRDYASFNLHARWGDGAIRHRLLFGVDYEDFESGSGFSLDSPPEGGFDIFDPEYGLLDDNLALLAVQPDSGDVLRFRTVGAYVQDIVEIGERWTVIAGGRYEEFDDFSQFGADLPDDDSSGDSFLPRVGAVYQPRPDVSLYASYAESFSPNPSTPARAGQPAFGPFEPERGRSYELGVKAELFERMVATLAVYEITKRNVLVSRDDGMGGSIVEAADQVDSRGFEIDLAGEVLPGLSLIASYAYTDARNPQSVFGDAVVNVAPHKASVAGTYRFGDGWSLGAGVFHVDRRFGGQSTGADLQLSAPFFMDGYTTVDLYAGYERAHGDATVFANLTLRNATDEDYDQSSGGALRVLPGQTRTLFGSVGVRF